MVMVLVSLVMPNLKAIEGILPQDVETWSHGG